MGERAKSSVSLCVHIECVWVGVNLYINSVHMSECFVFIIAALLSFLQS